MTKVVCALLCAWILCTWNSFVTSSTSFNVYWNVPSQQCHKRNVSIDVGQFGILQNEGDAFHGDKVTILYRPGAFPYINDEGEYIHGGVPQNANLGTHVQEFINTLNALVPLNFTGPAILDFEDYYPSYNLSWRYRPAAREWVEERHPDWSPEEVEEYAEESFNASSKDLFLSLLWVGRELRPGALWGYYHYPYCHNYQPTEEECKETTKLVNDKLPWFYKASSAIYPSLYVKYGDGFSSPSRRQHIRAHLTEGLRMRKLHNPAAPVLPYLWYRYHDIPDLLTPVDMVNTLGQAFLIGTDGAVIWGGSADVSTKEKCLELKSYAEEQLGPLVQYLLNLPRANLRHLISSPSALKRATRNLLIRRALRAGRVRPRTESNPSEPEDNVSCGNSIKDRWCNDD